MRNDVIANYASQLINILLRFFLVPIYLSRLGISAYGIISFYFSIESIMVLVDFGIGVSSAKLLAEKLKSDPQHTIRVIRSVELLYLAISVLIGVALFLSSDIVGNKWLTIDDNTIDGRKVVMLMAFLLTVGWPKSLYENFLLGQQKIIQKNIITTSVNIFRTLSMIYFITGRSGSIESYFWVMIVSVFVETYSLRILAFRKFAAYTQKAGFRELKPFLQFTSGVGIFSILSLFIFQLDKIFISKFLTTSDLGIYNLSATIPLAIFSLIYPVTSAAFPRLVNIHENSHGQDIYKKWNQVLSILCACYFAFIMTNLPFIANLWLKTESVKVNFFISGTLLSGVLLHSFIGLNINLFIANGKSKLVSTIYLAGVIVYALFLCFLVGKSVDYVSLGWVLCNIALLIGIGFGLYRNFENIFRVFLSNISRLICFLTFYFLIIFGVKSFLVDRLWKLLFSGFLLVILILIFYGKSLRSFSNSQ